VRIAILGGTFDPIHKGHLAAARTVARTFETDEVHFVPAFTPPHKAPSEITSPFHRFAMVALATAPFDKFRTSPVESDTREPRYSVDTLELMHRTYPDSSFLFIAGTDMYQDIESWKDYRRLFELTSFAVVQRPGFEMRDDFIEVEVIHEGAAVTFGDAPRVFHLPALDEDVSSTRIRSALKQGGDVGRWIPEPVYAYIRKHKLYE
jgi:nicotinate-nucleotide adenylyltransferase